MSWKPIGLGPCYTLTDEGLSITKEPTFEAAAEAGQFLQDMERRGPFWVGDWWADCMERWPEECYQLVSATGFELGTLHEYARVARKIPPKRRWIDKGVSYSHHEAVATLDEDNQRMLLARAHGEGLSTSAMRQEARKVRRAPVVEGEARLRGRFRVAYLDPDYKAISLQELADLGLQSHLQENAAVFLWCPESLRFDIKWLLDEWEVTHKRAFIWDRVMHQGPDPYLNVRHEHLLWCVRGKCPPDNLTPMLDSVVTIKRPPEQGVKPDRFMEIIEQLYEAGPYLQLLAHRRRTRKGWTFYGRQMGQKVA